jgi:hypothetical protein
MWMGGSTFPNHAEDFLFVITRPAGCSMIAFITWGQCLMPQWSDASFIYALRRSIRICFLIPFVLYQSASLPTCFCVYHSVSICVCRPCFQPFRSTRLLSFRLPTCVFFHIPFSASAFLSDRISNEEGTESKFLQSLWPWQQFGAEQGVGTLIVVMVPKSQPHAELT